MDDSLSCVDIYDNWNCVWSASCKESGINKEVSKDRIFANGIAAHKNPRYSKVLCCESYMYTFNHCILKVIKFLKYFQFKISTKTRQDKAITDVTFRRRVHRSRPNKATVKLCHRRQIPFAACPIDKNQKQESKKDKPPHKEHEKTNPDNNQQKTNPNQKQIKPKDQPNGQQRRIGPEPKSDLIDIAKEQLATEETGISMLKWMPCTIGCSIAGGVGLRIGVDLANLCFQFEIEGEDVIIVFSSGDEGLVPKDGTATIECDDPEATLIGPSLLTCMGWNEWDAAVPYCDYACNLLAIEDGTTEYTEQEGDNILDGGTAIVTCPTDQQITDDDDTRAAESGTTFTCDNGEWTEFKPKKCTTLCQKLSIKVFNATTEDIRYTQDVDQYVEDGGTAEITCNGDKVGEFTCNDGKWEDTCAESSCWSYLADVTNGYYKIFDINEDFSGSQSLCQASCSQLVTIHSEAENTHVVNLHKDTGYYGYMWLGLTYGPDQVLQWEDGTSITESYIPAGSEQWYDYTKKDFVDGPYCKSCRDDCLCRDCVEISSYKNYAWVTYGCNDTVYPACAFYVEGV